MGPNIYSQGIWKTRDERNKNSKMLSLHSWTLGVFHRLVSGGRTGCPGGVDLSMKVDPKKGIIEAINFAKDMLGSGGGSIGWYKNRRFFWIL